MNLDGLETSLKDYYNEIKYAWDNLFSKEISLFDTL
jgi:hypothetical protein